jgi:hypothetical protein
LRKFLVLLFACAVALAGCGGGGGDDNASSGSAGGIVTTDNTVSVKIGAGVGNIVNLPLTSVTVCIPGTSSCQTVDNVLVDTGSYGLRLMASALSLSLPQQSASNGGALANCAAFADGYTWGSVRQADLRIGGERASALAVQLIGDTLPAVPAECASAGGGNAENTPGDFGANGVLGIGPFEYDCGTACATAAQTGVYYSCASGACAATAVPLAQQIANPVTRFATDNNGSMLTLPAVGASGQASVTGTLTFGIGTQANNALGSAQVYTMGPGDNLAYAITTTYKGTAYPDSFIDSGSNGLFFTDASIPGCTRSTGFFCPASTLSLTATNTGANKVSGVVNFSVASADALLLTNNLAYSNLAGSGAGLGIAAFDWGLPFFYGRTVYTAIENRATPGGTGPYYAY